MSPELPQALILPKIRPEVLLKLLLEHGDASVKDGFESSAH